MICCIFLGEISEEEQTHLGWMVAHIMHGTIILLHLGYGIPSELVHNLIHLHPQGIVNRSVNCLEWNLIDRDPMEHFSLHILLIHHIAHKTYLKWHSVLVLKILITVLLDDQASAIPSENDFLNGHAKMTIFLSHTQNDEILSQKVWHVSFEIIVFQTMQTNLSILQRNLQILGWIVKENVIFSFEIHLIMNVLK